MTDEDVVRKAAGIMGAKVRQRDPLKEGWKPLWECYLTGDKSVDFCKRVLPYMGSRRKARIEFLLERSTHRILSKSEAGKLSALRRWGNQNAI